ncbi:MAG: NAD(P)H-dependent oxidoreductase [Candidatus Omnitrophota bacterium]
MTSSQNLFSRIYRKSQKKQKQMLGIMASARKGGNTDVLLDAALEAARGNGAIAEKIIVNDLKFIPCQDCDDGGRGKIEDDFQKIYEPVLNADSKKECMFYASLKRICSVLVVLIFMIFCVQDILMAKTGVIYSDGTLRITTPNSSIINIKRGDVMPRILAGYIVEVLDGSIDLFPPNGAIHLVAGNSIATIEGSDRVIVRLDPLKNKASFKMISGEIVILTGNATTPLSIGQIVRIGVDLKTGALEVKSLEGIITTMINGVMVSIHKNAIVKINIDPKTRNILVESVTGRIQVISIKGEMIDLAKGAVVSMQGSEIASIEPEPFAEEMDKIEFIPEEEPSEPEIPEASPHRP